jgi:hypothetical protein
MEPIRMPEALDPGRVLTDDREEMTAEEHRGRAQELAKALQESCAYGQQLWHDLDKLRTYLMESLPDDPRQPGPTRASASPTGPDDEPGWDAWIGAFATVTSALAGPHGDSGYGLSEARHAAQQRRSAPILHVYAEHPEVAAHEAGDQPPPRVPITPPKDGRARAVRIAATVALITLAIRGALPRRTRVVHSP